MPPQSPQQAGLTPWRSVPSPPAAMQPSHEPQEPWQMLDSIMQAHGPAISPVTKASEPETEGFVPTALRMAGVWKDPAQRLKDVGQPGKPLFVPLPEWGPAVAGMGEGPSFARTSGGRIKLGFDILQAGKEMGANLYTGQADQVVTKELMQNAIDAVKNTPGGKVNINFRHAGGELPPIIHVQDNGPGMTQGELETVFTNLHSSGKREQAGATGGKGVAKASFLLNVKKNVTNSTVAIDRAIADRSGLLDNIKTGKLSQEDKSFFSDPNEVQIIQNQLNDLATWKKTGASHVKYTFESTPEQLMTEGAPPIQASPQYPPTQLQRQYDIKPQPIQSGVSVEAHMHDKADPHLYNGSSFIRSLTENSKDLPPITATEQSLPHLYPDIKSGIRWGGPDVQDVSKTFPNKATLNLPYADVQFHWPEESEEPQYPPQGKYLNNGMFQFRESMPGRFEKQSGLPTNFITDIRSKVEEGHPDYPFTTNREALSSKMKEAINSWYISNIQQAAQTRTANATQAQYDALKPMFGRYTFFDSGGKLTEDEFHAFTHNPRAMKLYEIIGDFTRDIVRGLGGDTALNKIDKIGVILSDKIHGVYVPSPRTQKSAILINPFSFADKFGTADQAAGGIAHTILHEVVHDTARNHNEDFTSALGEAYAKLGVKTYGNWGQKINDILKAEDGSNDIHEDFHQLLDLYRESRGRPVRVPDVISGKGSHLSRSSPEPGGAEELDPDVRQGDTGPTGQPIPPSPSTALVGPISRDPGQRPTGGYLRRPTYISLLGQPKNLTNADLAYIKEFNERKLNAAGIHPDLIEQVEGRPATEREHELFDHFRSQFNNFKRRALEDFRINYGVDPPTLGEFDQVRKNYQSFQANPLRDKALPHPTVPLATEPLPLKPNIEKIGTKDPRFATAKAEREAKAPEKMRLYSKTNTEAHRLLERLNAKRKGDQGK